MKTHSTKAKRADLARRVSAMATDILGVPVALTPHAYRPTECLEWESEHETDRGPVRLHISVEDDGLAIYSKFAFAQLAPSDANPHSGKWNHYPADGADLARRLAYILGDLRPIAIPERMGPSRDDLWAHYRQEWNARPAA